MNEDPEILEFRNERKPGVGLLLTVMGLAALIVPNVSSGFEDVPWWASLLFGVVCLIPGLVMLVGLSVHRFDRGRKTVTSAWGLLVPFRSRERPTGDFRTVVICRERQTETRKRGLKTDTTHDVRRTFFVYPVKLVCEDEPPEKNLTDVPERNEGVRETLQKLREHGVQMHELEKARKASGRPSLTIGKCRSYDKAVEMAREVADFLDLKLCDLGVRKTDPDASPD